jgi:hypothetical protein
MGASTSNTKHSPQSQQPQQEELDDDDDDVPLSYNSQPQHDKGGRRYSTNQQQQSRQSWTSPVHGMDEDYGVGHN